MTKDYDFFSTEEQIIFKRFLTELVNSDIEKLTIINKANSIQVIIDTGATISKYEYKSK